MSQGKHARRTVAALCVVGALVVVLATGLAVARIGHANAGTVFDVTQIQAGLGANPRAWLGRTLLVRGTAWQQPCIADDSCVTPLPGLGSARSVQAGAGDLLPLAPFGPPDPVLTALRRIPLLDALVQGPQRVSFGTERTYRVRLQAVPPNDATFWHPYEALLVDAAPSP